MKNTIKTSIKYFVHKPGTFDSYPVTHQQWRDIKSGIESLRIPGNIFQMLLNGIIGLSAGLILSLLNYFLASEIPNWLIILYFVLLGVSISTILILILFMGDKKEEINNSKKEIISIMNAVEDSWEES